MLLGVSGGLLPLLCGHGVQCTELLTQWERLERYSTDGLEGRPLASVWDNTYYQVG